MSDLSSGTKTCPNCGREINLANLVSHQAFCYKNIIKCEKCKEPVDKSLIKEHDEKFHTKIKCECGKKIDNSQLDDHKKNECPKRQVKCDYCDLTTDLNKLQEHVEFCGSRTEKCDVCDQLIMKKDKKEHLDSYCTFPSAQPSKLPSMPETYSSQIKINRPKNIKELETDDDNTLPCEFCYKNIPLDQLIEHQIDCEQNTQRPNTSSTRRNFDYDTEDKSKNSKKYLNRHQIDEDDEFDYSEWIKNLENSSKNSNHSGKRDANLLRRQIENQTKSTKTNEDESFELPCEFCHDLFDIKILEDHQIACNLQYTLNRDFTADYDINQDLARLNLLADDDEYDLSSINRRSARDDLDESTRNASERSPHRSNSNSRLREQRKHF